MSETNEAGPDEVSAALDEEARDEAEQAWQAWLGSPKNPDQWLAEVYDQSAWAVDYLTAVCLGPRVREIQEGWDLGGSEPPWLDAGPEVKEGTDEEDPPGTGLSAAASKIYYKAS